jgi:hypothetical protein
LAFALLILRISAAACVNVISDLDGLHRGSRAWLVQDLLLESQGT